VTYSYSYRAAYGLSLSSDTPIPGLLSDKTNFVCPSLSVSLGPTPDWVRLGVSLSPSQHFPAPGTLQSDNPAFTLTSFGDDEFFQLSYSDGVRFVIDRATTRLWATYPPPLTIDDMATYLLGPVMGFILRRRNVLALHASSVSIAGQAFCLCGVAGSGKSTTAAALALAGVPVLAEDVSALREDRGALFVEPGYPRVCLWPDSVKELLGADGLARLTPTWEKCYLALDGGRATFESQSKPLGAVYLLSPRVSDNRAPWVEDVTNTREGLLELVQNTYMNWLLDQQQRAVEFDALSRLVKRVPIRRIVPHADASRIPALCDLIRTDAERIASGRLAVAVASESSNVFSN
jgi:hypothetical protein